MSTDSYSNTNIMYDYILSDLLKILSGLKPSTYHHIHLRNLEQAIQTYFKTLSSTSKNLQILPALSNPNMTVFALFSLPYAQNIIFLPVVINSTYTINVFLLYYSLTIVYCQQKKIAHYIHISTFYKWFTQECADRPHNALCHVTTSRLHERKNVNKDILSR